MARRDDIPASGNDRFETTRWSVVLAAAGSETEQCEAALTKLCQSYWYPLFAFARRRGYDLADAQDATQSFFTALLDKAYLKDIKREGGRFRSFLLTAFTRHLADQKRAEQAQKRGGRQNTLSLDFQAAEARYQNEPFHKITAEQLFEHHWALTLIEHALAKIEKEHAHSGKSELFAQLQTCLGKQKDMPYRVMSEQLGMSEGAFKTAVHRFRRRFGEILRSEIAETVTHSDEVEDELRSLFQTLQMGI